MERLLVSGATVSFFSLFIVGSDEDGQEEEEKMEDGGLSLTGSKKKDQKEEKYVIDWKLSHSTNKYCVFV